MKNEQSTDRIIREKLRNHASANPVHLWDAIEAELPIEKKDSRGLWWIAGGFLGLALLVVTGLYMTADNTTNVKTITDTNETTTTTEQLEDADSEKVALSVVANLEANRKEQSEETPIVNEDTTQAEESITAIEKANTTSENLTKASAQKEEKTVTDKSEEAKSTNTTTKKPGPIAATQTTVENSTSTKATNSTAEAYIEKENIVEPVAEQRLKSVQTNPLLLTALDLESKSLLSIKTEERELDWESLLQDPKCATFGKWLKLYFYADAFLSPDVVFKSLEPRNTDASDYADNRLATESQLFSYSAGARFSIVSNFGLALRSGLVYSQINEQFSYQEETNTVTITHTIGPGGTIESSDTTIVAGTNFIRTDNKYKSLDLPLILGYELSMKNFGLSINSGVFFNLTSSQKGTLLSPAFEPIDFSAAIGDGGQTAFRNSVNLSLFGSIAMYYIIDEHWQIMLEPQVRFYMDPVTRSSYQLEQRYTTAGLITGLRYRF